MLYVAPVGTSAPDMTVQGGKFGPTWVPAWEPVNLCDLTIEYDAPKNRYKVELLPLASGFAAVVSRYAGIVCTLGFESTDHTRRYTFPRVGQIELRIRKSQPAGWTFTLDATDGPQVFVAGSGLLAAPTSPGPVTRPRPPWVAPAAPYGGEAIDLVPGRLRGFREWKLLPSYDGASPRLASITANTVWPWTPTVEAHCHRAAIVRAGGTSFADVPAHDPADVPTAACSCGIYAKHKPFTGSVGMIAGVIEAWGKIEVGTNGFRARYARLVALANTNRRRLWGDRAERTATGETMAALSELYRVPTFVDDRDMWDAYPASDIGSLLDRPPEPPPCPGCEANRRGDYAMHDPACPGERGKSIHRNHVHISMASGGPVTGFRPSRGRAVDLPPPTTGIWPEIAKLIRDAHRT